MSYKWLMKIHCIQVILFINLIGVAMAICVMYDKYTMIFGIMYVLCIM